MYAHLFNLSLHRTGTQSVHNMFQRAGISSVHWHATMSGVDYQALVAPIIDDHQAVVDVLEPVFDRYVVINDSPVAVLYGTLLERFPNAGFFVLRRSSEAWVASVRKHVGSRELETFEKLVYWSYLPNRPETILEVSDSALMEMHERHHRNIEDYFASAPNFLMCELEGRGVGKALCEFSGIPFQPFRKVDYALGHDATASAASIDADITE